MVRGAPKDVEQMDQIILEASMRSRFGKKVAPLRREGKLPAILYGKSIKKPIPVTLNGAQTEKVLRTASSSSLIVVNVDGEEHTTLVRDFQIDYVRGTLQHVDFLVVSLTEKVRASVAVVVEGIAPIIEEEGGLLVSGTEQVEVESLPQNLPERFLVDVSVLESFGSSLHVRDLVIPEDVTVLTDLDELLVVATAPALEEIEEEVLDDELEEGEEGAEGEEGEDTGDSPAAEASGEESKE
jgi:large subunit ribosomal protein L25